MCSAPKFVKRLVVHGERGVLLIDVQGRFFDARQQLSSTVVSETARVKKRFVSFAIGNWGLEGRGSWGYSSHIRCWVLLHMFVRRLWRDCSAASLIEYCLAVGLISSLIVIAVEIAGTWVLGMWARLLVKLSG